MLTNININREKYRWTGYGIWFDPHSYFSLKDGSGFGKLLFFCVDNSVIIKEIILNQFHWDKDYFV